MIQVMNLFLEQFHFHKLLGRNRSKRELKGAIMSNYMYDNQNSWSKT